MKELSIEEKARRYDGAIKRLEDIETGKCQKTFMFTEGLFDYIFPELKESEDERIKSAAIEFVIQNHSFNYYLGISKDDVITWIEKQCGQKSIWSEEDKNMLEWVIGYLENKMLNTPISEERTACKNAVAWLEEKLKGEQKSVDKVEPKFKIGDYVVGKYISGYISEVRDDCYLLDYQGFPIDKQDNYHLWTIRDAKDGDVLSWDNGRYTIIFKELKDNKIIAHCSYNNRSEYFGTKGNYDTSFDSDLKFVPGTKEQRDFLFQKMKEAGYEWDNEKKELKKVDQKPIWSDDFEEEMDRYIEENFYGSADNGFFSNRTKRELEVEDVVRIGCHFAAWQKEQSNKELSDKPKQEWSEADEDTMKTILGCIRGDIRKKDSEKNSLIDWLKSLSPQPQWKPSEEQLKSLKEVIDVGHFTSYPNALETLYEQLKQL